jgi:hypothetical protein
MNMLFVINGDASVPYDRWTIVDTKWLVGLVLIMM